MHRQRWNVPRANRLMGNLVTMGRQLRQSREGQQAEFVQHETRTDLTWRLLLQVSSDDEIGLMFGDMGRLYVSIREDDLAPGRFDRVRGEMQFG